MSEYTLPDLPYELDALEPHYSSELLELHHGKHHAGYVKGANSTLEKLSDMRESGDFTALNQLQKNLAFHLSGHVLHSLFWRNMSPDGGGDPEGDLASTIKKGFGSIDAMREQMSEAATSLQGSGWASLAWEPVGGRLVVEQVFDHQGNIGNATLPILVLDMWEHAFYLQYRNEKAKWVDAYWEIVNWKDVAQRLEKVRKTAMALD